MPRRVARSDGLRALLVVDREYRLPRSTAPPPWSAPRGWQDPLLDDLKSGNAVVVGSWTLLGAMIAAGLPRGSFDRFGYGGADCRKRLVLDEQDRLTELA